MVGKFLSENYKQPLIIAGFTHCAIPLYLEDLKEIHELVLNKYQYQKDVLSSKIRTVYDLQPQSFFNTYGLSIKKRKLNTIPYMYYDIAFLNKANFDIELFVMNTSGDRRYTKAMNDKVTSILKDKYGIPSPFELETNKIVDISNYIKKEEYSKLKKEYDNLDKDNKELKKKNKEILEENEKNEIKNKENEKMLKKEIDRLIKEIKEKNITNIALNYTIIKNNTNDINDININNYYFFKNFFNVTIVILLIIFFAFVLAEHYKYKYYSKDKYYKNNNNVLQLSEMLNKDNSKEDFNRLPSDENNA